MTGMDRKREYVGDLAYVLRFEGKPPRQVPELADNPNPVALRTVEALIELKK